MHLNFCESIISHEREMCVLPQKNSNDINFWNYPLILYYWVRPFNICYRSTNTRTDYLKVDMHTPICLEFLWSVFSLGIDCLSVTLA